MIQRRFYSSEMKVNLAVAVEQVLTAILEPIMKRLCLKRFSIVPRLLLLSAALLCWSSVAVGQGTTEAKPATSKQTQAFSPGIELGQKLPTISLKNQKGETISMQSMLQTGSVALIVFRSADW